MMTDKRRGGTPSRQTQGEYDGIGSLAGMLGRRTTWGDDLQDSCPSERVMRPALDVCHGPLNACEHGRRVATDNTTTPPSKKMTMLLSNCGNRKSIRAIFL